MKPESSTARHARSTAWLDSLPTRYLWHVPTLPDSRRSAAPDEPRARVHLVSHTHWDREWYHTTGRFRQRLVPLVDALLDNTPQAGVFLLDGQTILLADYLLVRPERRERLAERLRQGRIEAGPWFVLADNLIPSGEAIIRNLEAGARALRALGVTAPRVAYCPDTFGHPAMLPAVAAGFGFEVAIVWRGLGGGSHPPVNTLWWHAPDGSRVLVHHLPPNGYETGSALPTDEAAAHARWQTLSASWRAKARTGVVLLPNGADHHARQRDRANAVAALARAAAAADVVLLDSSLSAFALDLHRSAASRVLPTIAGELRDSYGYTWTLQGTFGTRAAQKRRNAKLERALIHDVEPWLVLAWLHGGDAAHAIDPAGRLTLAQLPALLVHTWESVLRTHPHDTLCGCSSDAVAQAMDDRQRDVASQIPGLRVAALQLALQHDVVVAREQSPVATPSIIVRNRVGRRRGGIAELRLLETIGDVRVGPGSADTPPPRAPRHGPAPTIPGVVVQAGAARLLHDRRESPQHYPDDDLVRERRVVAWVPDVPAHGLLVLPTDNSALAPSAIPPTAVSLTTTANGMVMSNGLLQVTCGRDGVTVRSGDRVLRDALCIETCADAGDSYTTSLRGAMERLHLVDVRRGATGPLRASVRLRWTTRAAGVNEGESPAVGISTDVESMISDAPRRYATRGHVHVEAELILDAGAAHLRGDVRGENQRTDHRLRLVWNTDVSHGDVWADAAFGPVPRPVITSDSPTECAPPTMPMHRWAATAGRERGAALLADGLAEVEVADGTQASLHAIAPANGTATPNGGRLALTLLRAIGELSRADVPERPGHAGWPCATPHAQSLGAFRARVGLMLFGAWDDRALAAIEDACDDLLLPLTGESWRDYRGDRTLLAGPLLTGNGLRASAVTLTDDGQSLILRATNVTDSEAVGSWSLPATGPWLITPVRLDGSPDATIGAPTVVERDIPLRVAPRALSTMCVSRAD